jgi:hypothetical protein
MAPIARSISAPPLSDRGRPFPGKLRPSDHVVRALLATARAEALGHEADPVRLARKTWPGDAVTPLILTRAATVPADTATTGWASDLAQFSFIDLVQNLGPLSAVSGLLERALQLNLDKQFLLVPGVVAAASNVPFVAGAAQFRFRSCKPTLPRSN